MFCTLLFFSLQINKLPKKYAVLGQGETMAVGSSYDKPIFELNESDLIFKA